MSQLSWTEAAAIAGLVTNILVSGFTLFRACQAVKEIRSLHRRISFLEDV